MEIHSQSRPEDRAKSFVNWMTSTSYSYSQHNNNNKKLKALTFCNDEKHGDREEAEAMSL